MSLFNGIEKASINQFGQYILPGRHRLKLKRCLTGRTRAPQNKPFFVTEFVVVASTNPEMRVGEERNFMVMLDVDAALGNLKAFGVAAYTALNKGPVDEATITATAMEALVEKDGTVAAGTIYDVSGILRNSKKTGKDYTNLNWTAVY
jgi:hypothetical protein